MVSAVTGNQKNNMNKMIFLMLESVEKSQKSMFTDETPVTPQSFFTAGPKHSNYIFVDICWLMLMSSYLTTITMISYRVILNTIFHFSFNHRHTKK